MGFETPYTAIRSDGHFEHFDTIEGLHHMRASFAAKHRNVERRWDGSVFLRDKDWIVRDAMGATVVPDDVPWPIRGRAWWASRADRTRAAMDRGLPIPGCGRRGNYRWHRRISHHGDNRAASAVEADLVNDLHMLESRQLASFRKARLLDGRDGPHRSIERCWKDQRSTRWK